VIAVPLLLAVGALAAVLALAPAQSPAPRAMPVAGRGPAAGDLPPPAGLLVDVSGAVAHPGLYRMRRGDRVELAIAAAGGVTSQADPQRAPNLAGRLRDGEQVRVPFARSPGAGRGPGGGTRSSTERVPINSATAEELAAVPGFTPELAAELVDHRSSFGPLTSLSQLVTDLGMSRADFALAKPQLSLR
jgi:competence protein ComEA